VIGGSIQSGVNVRCENFMNLYVLRLRLNSKQSYINLLTFLLLKS